MLEYKEEFYSSYIYYINFTYTVGLIRVNLLLFMSTNAKWVYYF